jgi:hypothetical protein
MLEYAIDHVSLPLCLFINGLDELDEEEEYLLKLMNNLSKKPCLKICLSSRPSQSFMNAFEQCPQLKLQDLTRRDIEVYVADRFHKDSRMNQLLQEDSWRGQRLIKDVIDKAAGVFLWVELATKILLKGITNRDNWDMMQKRLDLLPKGMENLYMHMWSRLGEDKELYRAEAALYFRIILAEESSLLQLLIATDKDLRSTLPDSTTSLPRADSITAMCKDAEVRILTRCAGLLEVDDLEQETSHEAESDAEEPDEQVLDKNESDSSNLNHPELNRLPPGPSEMNGGKGENFELHEDSTIQHLHQRIKVRFIHRTARDFLVKTKEGQLMLGDTQLPALKPHALLVKSYIGLDRLLPKTRPIDLFEMFRSVRNAQAAENDALDSLMDTIESYCASKYGGVPTGPNWFHKFIGL